MVQLMTPVEACNGCRPTAKCPQELPGLQSPKTLPQ